MTGVASGFSRIIVVSLALVAVLVVGPGHAREGAVSLGVAGRVNQDIAAAASGSFVALTWAGTSSQSGTDIYLAVSRNAGRSFSAPVRVNVTAGEAQVGGEQPPRVVLVARPAAVPEIVVVWRARRGSDTMLLAARSTDGGRTFGASRLVPGAEGPGNRGWQSLVASRDGRVSALWLDHRDTATRGTSGTEHHHGGGATTSPAESVARAQLSQVFFGPLDGAVHARSLGRGVCYCCSTAVVPDGDDIYAAWRHVYAGSHRDIAFAVSRDRGLTFADPVRASEDEWQLDGCPENGPALAVDSSHRVHVVWPTLVHTKGRERLKLFHAMTSDGLTFTARQELPAAGDAYHPKMTVGADGSVLIAWDELVDGRRQVRLVRWVALSSAEAPFAQSKTFGVAPMSAMYPAIAAVPGHAIVAWVNRAGERSTIEVRRFAY